MIGRKSVVPKEEIREWLREELEYAVNGLRMAETTTTNNPDVDARTAERFKRRVEVLSFLCKKFGAHK